MLLVMFFMAPWLEDVKGFDFADNIYTLHDRVADLGQMALNWEKTETGADSK